jgi:hypothetical protein
MQIKNTPGDKPDTVVINVKNDESTALETGELVVYAMDGTDDGLAVEKPSSSSAAMATTFFAGVVKDRLPADGTKMGTAQIHGFCRRARIVRQTRAASTDSFASFVALALGDRLIIDTVNNAFSRSDAGAQSAAQAFAVMAETIASAASSASATSDTRTAITAWAKVFLRAL